jgi:hypothetical protein
MAGNKAVEEIRRTKGCTLSARTAPKSEPSRWLKYSMRMRVLRRVVIAYLAVSFLTHISWLIAVGGGSLPLSTDIGMFLLAPLLSPGRVVIWVMLATTPPKSVMATYPNFWVPAAVFVVGCIVSWIILRKRKQPTTASTATNDPAAGGSI